MWFKKNVVRSSALAFYFLIASTLAHATLPNESVVTEFRNFIGIPSTKTYFKSSIRGIEALSYQSCIAWIEVDPNGVRIKIEKEKSALSIAPAIAEIPLSGMNSLGDRIEVTQLVKFPTDLLVTVYYARESSSRSKGDITLVIHRELEGSVNSLSIADGEGIVNCVKPESLMFDT